MSGMMSSKRRKREWESGNNPRKRVEIVVIDPEDVEQCGICNLKDPPEPFVTACAHGFCRKCIVQYFKSMMISSDLKPLCCPYSSCSSEVRHADLTNLVGEEHVRNYKNWLVSALDNLYNRRKSFPISNARSSSGLLCVNCSCDSANLIQVNQVPQLSCKEVQGVLKASGLKCARSKKAGVESLMNYFGNNPLLWICTSCSNMWCDECGMEVAHDEIHTERCTAVNTPQHHHRSECQLYAAMMDLDSVSRHYLISSSSVEGKTGKTISTSASNSAVWAKGTGFGGGVDNKNVCMALDAARKRQLEEDNLIKRAVSSLIKALNDSPYLSVTVCAILCMGGILNRVLLQLATNDSMLDIFISERQDLYLKVIELLDAIAPYPELKSVLSGSSDDLLESQEYTIMQKLETLYKQAKLMLHNSNQAAQGDLTLAMELCRCYEKLGSGSKSVGSSVSRQDAGLEVEIVEISPKTMYIEKLRPLQFKLLSTATEHFSHYFRTVGDSSIDKGGAHNHKRMLRIQKEVASLSTSLPLQWESSIHICVEEDRMDMLKALIVGPCGTPYQNGIFLFDIFLPSDYPQVPPKVQFLTTGGGTVRFNPNLYANGKVCLSLLGTWSGPGWIPGKSTLLQVLVSIQSLIFVKDPYYNEPGYDMRESSSAAEAENMQHRENTLSLGILLALESPEKMFHDVIGEHFRFKKQEIEKQCDEWINSTHNQQAKSRMSVVSASIKSKLRAWC